MRLPSGVTVPGLTSSREGRERLEKAATPLNLHIAAAVALLLLCLYFGVRLLLLSGTAGSRGDEAIVAAQARVAAAELSARPLRGVDSKLQTSDQEAARFYAERFPYAYSDVAAQLGILTKQANVRLGRASYVAALPANGVTELRIDASVIGDYHSLAEFISGLERDRSFFLIENIVLSGAQNGLVNLQLRIGTYLREPMSNTAPGPAQMGARP